MTKKYIYISISILVFILLNSKDSMANFVFSVEENKEDVSLADNSKLRSAVEADDDRTVKKIIESGQATPDTRVVAPGYNSPGMPILTLAARSGSVKVAEYLVSAKAELNLTTPANETALMLAAFFNDEGSDDINPSYEKHERIAKLLVDAGASIDGKANAFTAMAYSAYYNHIRITRYLLDHGGKVDDFPVNNRVERLNALMFASRNGHKDLVRLLLQRGANPNIINSWDKTAINLAEDNNQTHLLPLLLCAKDLQPGQSFDENCKGL